MGDDFNFTTYCEESMNESKVDCALWAVSFYLFCARKSSVEGFRSTGELLLSSPLLSLVRRSEWMDERTMMLFRTTLRRTLDIFEYVFSPVLFLSHSLLSGCRGQQGRSRWNRHWYRYLLPSFRCELNQRIKHY